MGAAAARPLLERQVSARDHDAIAVAERVLAILDQGGFSATYKFALFTAILDLCIEKTSVHGVPRSPSRRASSRRRWSNSTGIRWSSSETLEH